MLLKNGTVLTIRKAKKEDAPQVIAYCNRVGGESNNLSFGKDEFFMSQGEEAAFLDGLYTAKTSVMLLGFLGEELVCTGSALAPSRKRFAHQAEIALAVKQNKWGLGIGSAMLKNLIAFAKENGKTEVLYLDVISDNIAAIRLYEKMGFVTTGYRKNFFKIGNTYGDILMMELQLRSIENAE